MRQDLDGMGKVIIHGDYGNVTRHVTFSACENSAECDDVALLGEVYCAECLIRMAWSG